VADSEAQRLDRWRALVPIARALYLAAQASHDRGDPGEPVFLKLAKMVTCNYEVPESPPPAVFDPVGSVTGNRSEGSS
jgi:hypothetical protein